MSKLKLLPLGGMGNVTKNMYLYEFDGQILIVDCGIGFPSSEMLGVDVLIPDISYLKDKEHQIVGMLLTHAHDDHIAALPYILPQLPPIPIYASKLTAGFAGDRLKDFNLNPAINIFPDDSVLELGPFRIESVHVTHSVPDARHYAIHTPLGTVYHGSDFKFDLTPVDGVISDYQKIARLGSEGILCLLSDCLRSEKEGHSLSESILTDTFEREIRDTKGKFIITAMSSNIHRIQQAVNVALDHGRHIAFVGRSIEQNIQTAIRLGFFHIPPKAIVSKKKINEYPADRLCIIIAGSQGQPESSLTRASTGEHSLITINPNDKVVFSTEPIPGNENYVYTAIDNLSKLGADVAYSDVDDAMHVSGHASALEQKLLIALTKPKYLFPIGGTYRHMIQYRKLTRQMGYPDQTMFMPEDGQMIEFDETGAHVGETIKLKHVMVDGAGIGDVGNVVLADRHAMADSGIVVLIIPISEKTQQFGGRVEIVSRGLVFMRESKELMDKIQTATAEAYYKYREVAKDNMELRNKIKSEIEDLIYQETQRSPLILPVIMTV
jgi:ribonuclease J